MPTRLAFRFVLLAGPIFLLSSLRAADTDLPGRLRELPGNVFPADAEKSKELGRMLSRSARERRHAANDLSSKQWREIKTRADWEKFRDAHVEALRASLGTWPAADNDLKARATKTIDGDGFKIENLVFESRPGLLVTANLYVPSPLTKSMPGIIVCPSHHNPKSQGELQDMGMSWARQGCLVLVPDNFGHGERRQHPFVDAKSYPRKFAVSRQDYYFRYNTSLQLYVVGESLMGWIAWDLKRCVDVLLARPGIDKSRVLLLGSVAGGGDPAAVVGALDPRITAVGPFNFGGAQPETVFPLPADAEASFDYAGGGSWESTRNLRHSAHDGFLPWVIVGGIAPRRLIYGHEFAWDRDHDPVWKRLTKIYDIYQVPDNLASAHGSGSVKGRPPESTHCNNIGPVHRKSFYPALNRWFTLESSAEKEYKTRHTSEELLCLNGIKPKTMVELAEELGNERILAARKRRADMLVPEFRRRMQVEWGKLLGDVEPKDGVAASVEKTEMLGEVQVQRIVLKVEAEVVVPLVLLTPAHKDGVKLPVVVAFAQQGKQEILRQRSDVIAELLAGGAAVCLPDLRGTGETRPGNDRGRRSSATSISASELMLGQTLLGSRLRDLRSVLRYLRTRAELDAGKMALWGDSFASVNSAEDNVNVPLDIDKLPEQAEPLGGLLALFGALFEPDVKAIYGQGGLAGYQTLLQSQFLYVPHDAIVPGALTVGDLGDVAAALAPRPLRLQGLVDGLNRRVSAERLEKAFAPARLAYQGAAERLTVQSESKRDDRPAAWLLAQLRAK